MPKEKRLKGKGFLRVTGLPKKARSLEATLLRTDKGRALIIRTANDQENAVLPHFPPQIQQCQLAFNSPT